MVKETLETKIIFALPRLLKRLFKKRGGVRTKKGSLDRESVRRDWQQIEEKMSLNNPSAFQSAVLSADKLLDYCLKELGASGETMGERLKMANHYLLTTVVTRPLGKGISAQSSCT